MKQKMISGKKPIQLLIFVAVLILSAKRFRMNINQSNHIMKHAAYLSIVILMLAFSCSKSSDPSANAGAGCTFTFKGTSYTMANSVCGTASGTQTVAAVSNNQALNLYKYGAIGAAGDQILFTLNMKTGESYSSLGSTPSTITVSGKTWTFSGTLENDDDGTTGQISGKCTCSN